MKEGPSLEPLLRRIAECPPSVLEAAAHQPPDSIAALIADVIEDLVGRAPTSKAVAGLARQLASDERHRRIAVLAAWVLAGVAVEGAPPDAALALFTEELADRSSSLDAAKAVGDEDRREELGRVLLHALGLRPRGETEEQALDRLLALDSRERKGILLRARERLRRVREIREAMKRKADEEAAARATGE